MAKLNLFIRICIALVLVLGIVYLGTLVNFIFRPILSLFSVILIPLMLAGFFYYLLRPVVNFMEKHRIPRTLAIIIIYIVIAVLLVAFGLIVWPSLRTQLINFVENAPILFNTLTNELQQLEDSEWLSGILPADFSPLSQLTEYLNKGFAVVTNYVTGLFSFFSNFAIVLFTFPIMLFYMLKEGGKFGRKIVSFIPKRFRKEGSIVVEDIDNALSGFIVGRVIINLALGVLMYFGFLLIGLPYALLLTVVAVIMNFIPFVGAILSAIPVFIVGFIESPSTAIWSIVIILVAQQIQDNLIAPYIFGKQLDIHPLTTIILILVGGDVAGMIGFLLIIPVYMILKIVVTKSYEMFFKNRWENI